MLFFDVSLLQSIPDFVSVDIDEYFFKSIMHAYIFLVVAVIPSAIYLTPII